MIYDYTVATGTGGILNLADYRGKVIMVVNTATGCGFTPQYAPIEQMYRDYRDQGLEILDMFSAFITPWTTSVSTWCGCSDCLSGRA